MICYKVIHKYKLQGHYESKKIGIYSSHLNAKNAIEVLKDKDGFRDTCDGFIMKKVFRFHKPRLVDKTYWVDGFMTYKH